MSDPFLGEIRMVGFNFAPRGWALCNGQILAINTNTALFSLLGTYYGGNGTTTFALPNMQSRVPIHYGTGTGLSPYAIGQMSGSENVTLTQQQMPLHNHLLNASGTDASAATPAGNYNAITVDPTTLNQLNSYGTASSTTMNGNAVSNAGGSQPHTNIQPYLCVNFIIALQGIFPSRN